LKTEPMNLPRFSKDCWSSDVVRVKPKRVFGGSARDADRANGAKRVRFDDDRTPSPAPKPRPSPSFLGCLDAAEERAGMAACMPRLDRGAYFENHVRMLARGFKCLPRTELQAVLTVQKYEQDRDQNMKPIDIYLSTACFWLAVKQFETQIMSVQDLCLALKADSRTVAGRLVEAENHVLEVVQWNVIDPAFLKTHSPVEIICSEDECLDNKLANPASALICPLEHVVKMLTRLSVWMAT